jgi:uncharacterized protein
MTPTPARTIAEQPDVLSSSDFPQHTRGGILAVWVAVTLPMSLLGWIGGPWLAHHIGGRDPFVSCVLLAFDIGLVWQIVLVAVLVRRERGSLSWPAVREALRLGAPREPHGGRVGGRVWWWALAFTVSSVIVNFLPIDPPGPNPRDFPQAIQTGRAEHFFHHNLTGFSLELACAILAPVAEELVFRGWLLPRSRAVFGRGDVVANGVLFTLYHLHQPWSMPATFIDGTLNQAFPSKRFGSTWMGIITHTALSIPILAVVLPLTL